jgi:hypothetical protein
MEFQGLEEVITEENKKAEITYRKNHFKILADLFRDGTADISNDPKWVAMLNKPRGFESNPKLTLEQYMNLFPEDCQDAMQAAKYNKDSLMNDGINRKSLAFYSFLGCPPDCISKLFGEVYPEAGDRKKAWYRFFKEFPAFKVTQRPL